MNQSALNFLFFGMGVGSPYVLFSSLWYDPFSTGNLHACLSHLFCLCVTHCQCLGPCKSKHVCRKDKFDKLIFLGGFWEWISERTRFFALLKEGPRQKRNATQLPGEAAEIFPSGVNWLVKLLFRVSDAGHKTSDEVHARSNWQRNRCFLPVTTWAYKPESTLMTSIACLHMYISLDNTSFCISVPNLIQWPLLVAQPRRSCFEEPRYDIYHCCSMCGVFFWTSFCTAL